MSEHRLIERVIKMLNSEFHRISETNNINSDFIDSVTDFFRTYSAWCHEGKETNILFRDLSKKKLSIEHRKIMEELAAEHIRMWTTVNSLAKAKESYTEGNLGSLVEIIKTMKELTTIYPKHIEKEENLFYYPTMDYFTPQELDIMLKEFWELDRRLIHEKYQQVVDLLEKANK
ncbi:MAG: hypothetical protein QG670_1535 [Thermoproteota archaeon]|nr:hypothetical protein [Thermoproteota archaeon]